MVHQDVVNYVCGKNLKNMNYDIIKYDAGDVRNKSIVTYQTNMSDKTY